MVGKERRQMFLTRKNLNMVDMRAPETLCKVYNEEDIKNIEIHYDENGLPDAYSASAYDYAAHLAWKDYCVYLKLKPSLQRKIGAYKLDFQKLGVDPQGDYREVLEEQHINKICSGEV